MRRTNSFDRVKTRLAIQFTNHTRLFVLNKKKLRFVELIRCFVSTNFNRLWWSVFRRKETVLKKKSRTNRKKPTSIQKSNAFLTQKYMCIGWFVCVCMWNGKTKKKKIHILIAKRLSQLMLIWSKQTKLNYANIHQLSIIKWIWFMLRNNIAANVRYKQKKC